MIKILKSLFLLLVTSGTTFGQTAKVHFRNFTLEIEPLQLWEQSRLTDRKFKNDAEVDLDLGETLEGAEIKLINPLLSDIKVEMRYETSMTIMDEGPHCDLVDWKHFTSDWSELPSDGSDTYKALSYSTKDKERFPEVYATEIAEAVKQSCPGWEEHAQSIKSPNDYPGSVGVSKYFLKISGIAKSGKLITRILILNVPMGC